MCGYKSGRNDDNDQIVDIECNSMALSACLTFWIGSGLRDYFSAGQWLKRVQRLPATLSELSCTY